MSANIKASTDGTQAIIGVGGVDQMTVSNAGVVTANSFVGNFTGNLTGNASSATALATGSTTARTLADRFADVANVLDFGAIGNGVADDTQAIRDAITAAGTGNGTIVYLPKGNYLVSGPIQQPYDGVTIKGDGMRTTRIYRNSDWNDPILGNNLFVFAAGTLIPEEGGVVNDIFRTGGGISDLSIISNSKMLNRGSLIYCLNSKQIILENIELYNGYIAITCKGVTNSTIQNIYITADLAVMDDTRSGDTKAISLEFSRGTFKSNTIRFDKLFISSSYPPNSGAGYEVNLVASSIDGTWISDSYFGGAASKNLVIAPRVSAETSPAATLQNRISGLKITSCWFDYSIGISIENIGFTTTVRNIELIGCTFYLLNGFGENAIKVSTSLLYGLKIIGGRSSDASRASISLIEGNNIIIDGFNVVSGNLYNWVSAGCIEVNSTGLTNKVNGVIIQNCQLGTDGIGGTGLTAYGVVIGAGTKNYHVINNDLRGNAISGFVTNSTSNVAENAIVSKNIGYRTENSGFVTFNPGETSKIINHRLDRTPLRSDINIIQATADGAAMGVPWITSITSTQFTINFATSPASPTTVRWKVGDCTIIEI